MLIAPPSSVNQPPKAKPSPKTTRKVRSTVPTLLFIPHSSALFKTPSSDENHYGIHFYFERIIQDNKPPAKISLAALEIILKITLFLVNVPTLTIIIPFQK